MKISELAELGIKFRSPNQMHDPHEYKAFVRRLVMEFQMLAASFWSRLQVRWENWEVPIEWDLMDDHWYRQDLNALHSNIIAHHAMSRRFWTASKRRALSFVH